MPTLYKVSYCYHEKTRERGCCTFTTEDIGYCLIPKGSNTKTLKQHLIKLGIITDKATLYCEKITRSKSNYRTIQETLNQMKWQVDVLEEWIQS